MQGEQEIDDILEETDDVIPFKYSITSYGTDYPVDSLVRRLEDGDIIVPNFQRGYVWSLREASRFVESLLLGLPVPSIFLSAEQQTQRLLVIDGQQRLLTLLAFLKGAWPITEKSFRLRGVTPEYENLSYQELPPHARRQLLNSPLHAIIVRQDQPSEDSSSIYHIFERLNTSGVSLTPQEIRTAIYHGPFIDLLRRLNQNHAWRAIYGTPNRLMRDQELILRFLALYYEGERYRRPMKGFLNSFAAAHRESREPFLPDAEGVFTSVIEFVYKALGKRAFKFSRVLNAALFDSIMVGVARRLRSGPITDLDNFVRNYDALIQSGAFREAVERATADEESVFVRIYLATDSFTRIK